MLGRKFFSVIDELKACSNFASFVDVVDRLFPSLFGLGEYGLLAFNIGRKEPYFMGAAADNDRFTNLQQQIYEFWVKQQTSGENEKYCKDGEGLISIITGPGGLADERFWVSRIAAGDYHQVYLVAMRDTAYWSEEERERFLVLEMFCQPFLEQLSLKNFDAQCRKQHFTFRGDHVLSYFQYEEGRILPTNHSAVEFTEKYWGTDEAIRKLPAETVHQLLQGFSLAWQSPIEALWVPVQVDLGAGPTQIFTIPRFRGEAVIMLPDHPTNENLADVSNYLTRRQIEIMDWIAEGKTSSEVAVILNISPRTVEKHLEAIFFRLGVENRIAAVRRYLELKGLLGE